MKISADIRRVSLFALFVVALAPVALFAATASVPMLVLKSAGIPMRRARSTYLFSATSVSSRTRSTSSTPWKVAESTTATDMKTTLWK